MPKLHFLRHFVENWPPKKCRFGIFYGSGDDRVKEKWGEAIRSEVTGLFDNDTFLLNEKPLPADEIIPAKLACKTKLNVYGDLDKLKARICR